MGMLCVGVSNVCAETTSVGTDNTTGWWVAFSDYYTIGQNHTLKVSFKNHSSKAENWFNYIGVITTDADRGAAGYSEYAVMRADCYGWQGDLNTNNNTTWFVSNTNNYNWDTFKDDMDGASVVMTVKRQGAKVTMRFDVTTAAETPATYYHEFVINCGDGTQNIRAFLTTQNGHLTDISSSDLDNEALNYTSTYTVPDGWAIKNTFIGKLSNDGASVAPESFKNVTTLPSAWDKGDVNSVEVVWKDKVATAAINASQSGTPTYVGGNTMRAYLRAGGDGSSIKYASYNLPSTVSKGKLFFATDVFADGDNTTTGPVYIRLVDSEGNPVLTLRPYSYNTNQTAYGYIVGDGELTSLGGNTVWRTYQGYGIKDLVVDLETGAVDLKLDLINRQKINNVTNWYHVILPFTINVGTGKNIAKVQIGKGSISSKNLYMYMDNVQLFSMEQQYSYTINYTNGGNIIKTVSGTDFEGEVINAESSIEVSGVTYVPTQQATTSLTVTTIAENNVLNVPVVGSVPYTITYKLGNDEIDSESGYAEIGTQVTAAYTESFWKSNVKYYVTSTTTTFDITSANNDFVVDVRLAATDAVATVNAVCGGSTHKSFVSAAGVEGEAVTVYYTHVVQSDVDSKFYVVNTDNFGKAMTYGATTNVDYTLDSDIVFYSELDGANYENEDANASGGFVRAYNTSATGVSTNLEPGLYTVYVKVTEGRNRNGGYRGLSISVAGKTIVDTGYGSAGLHEIAIIAPEENSAFRLYKGYNETDWIDYVIIRKTGDLPATVTTTLGTNGYATFASPYNLDLTTANLPSGLTAYKAAVEGTSVKFTQLNQVVPANTGILLKGDASGSYDIPVATTSTAVDGNAFLVNTAGTTFTADADYYYFGLMKNTLTFGKFDPETVAIPASKAYLKVLKSSIDNSPARSLTISFDDETTTGIDNVNVNHNDNWFDLQGRRVNQPSKGLYIMNGKKVVIK